MGKFAKGQSGNPGGRPRVLKDVKELARQYTTHAIETLVDMMLYAENERTRVAAAEALLDRGYGKPAQAVTGEDGGPVSLVTRIELVALKPSDDCAG